MEDVCTCECCKYNNMMLFKAYIESYLNGIRFDGINHLLDENDAK